MTSEWPALAKSTRLLDRVRYGAPSEPLCEEKYNVEDPPNHRVVLQLISAQIANFCDTLKTQLDLDKVSVSSIQFRTCQVLGLKWQKTSAPKKLPRSDVKQLRAQLRNGKLDFSNEEWDAFGITDLSRAHKVDVDDNRFEPVGAPTTRYFAVITGTHRGVRHVVDKLVEHRYINLAAWKLPASRALASRLANFFSIRKTFQVAVNFRLQYSTRALGLRWKAANLDAAPNIPQKGKVEELRAKLRKNKLIFSINEWESLGIIDISRAHVIDVDDRRFKPVGAVLSVEDIQYDVKEPDNWRVRQIKRVLPRSKEVLLL